MCKISIIDEVLYSPITFPVVFCLGLQHIPDTCSTKNAVQNKSTGKSPLLPLNKVRQTSPYWAVALACVK